MLNLNRKLLGLCVGIALSSASLSTHAANGDDISQLLNQAHFWFEQGRPDFSREAWKKVLLIQPNNSEALSGLSELEALNTSSLNQGLLNSARSAAASGNYNKSLSLYKQVFAPYNGNPPTSYLAAEYYMALGGSEKDWDEAHKGLQGLVSNYPSNKRYQVNLATVKTFRESTRAEGVRALHRYKSDKDVGLEASKAWNDAIEWLGGSDENWISTHADLNNLYRSYPDNAAYSYALGKLKTYREGYRREGIELLRGIASHGKYGSKATSAWKQALMWMGSNRDDEWLYDAYLQQVPGDYEIEQKRASLPAAPVAVAPVKRQKPKISPEVIRGRQISQGYQLLDSDQHDQAIDKFNTILTRSPNNPEALKGLGITYLRLQNFQEAERFLSLALDAAPERNADLYGPLEEARFWGTYNDANWAHKQGNYGEAYELALIANSLRPTDLETNLLLARIEAGQQNHNGAATYYETVLQADPNNQEARDGLSGALSGQGFNDSTGQTISKYNLPDGEFLAYRNMVEAAALRAEAAQGATNEEAIKLLSRAQRLQPQDPWIRLDLARRYRAQNRPDVALALLDGLISAYPNFSEAYHAKAIYHAQYNELYEGLQALEAIPDTYRNDKQAQLYKEVYRQLWIKQKKLEADQLIAIKDFAGVREIIAEMELVEQHDPDAMLTRAELLADIGERGQAMDIVNSVRSLVTPNDIGFKTHLATVLLKARATSELGPLLTELENTSVKLTNRERYDIEKLRLGQALQVADGQRSQGHYKDALATLHSMLKRFGDDENLKLARASIFKEGGYHEESRQLYQELLNKNPKNRAAYAGMAGSLMEEYRYVEAREVVDKGLTRVLYAPELLAIRGKLKAMRGEYNSAAQDLQQSLFDDNDSRDYSTSGAGGGASLMSYQRGTWQFNAHQDLRELNNRKINNIFIGPGSRTRDGDEGLNQFSEVALPILIRNYRDYENMTGLSLQPVALDAGTLKGDGDDASRFGSLVLDRANFINDEFTMQESGVGINGYYRTRNFMLDLGTTPVGFRINNVLGGLHWLYQGYRSKVTTSVSRRAVKDSVLSYAGLQDPVTDQEWGAVTKTGLDLRFSRGLNNRGVYAQAGYHLLEGQEVEDNDVASAKAGIYWQLAGNDRYSITTGLNASWQSFDKNLNFFTLGHGGYFSPQQQTVVSIPIQFQGTNGQFSYRVGADFGQQSYETDESLVFPIDPDLQTEIETLKQTSNPAVTTVYDAEDVSDTIYNVRAELEYAISRRFSFGGWVNATSVDDFEEMRGGIYLRRYALPRTTFSPLFTDDVEDKLHELW